jgi:hypothetical protein
MKEVGEEAGKEVGEEAGKAPVTDSLQNEFLLNFKNIETACLCYGLGAALPHVGRIASFGRLPGVREKVSMFFISYHTHTHIHMI